MALLQAADFHTFILSVALRPLGDCAMQLVWTVNWHNVWVWMINAKIGSFGIRVTALAGEMQQAEVQNAVSTGPHDA